MGLLGVAGPPPPPQSSCSQDAVSRLKLDLFSRPGNGSRSHSRYLDGCWDIIFIRSVAQGTVARSQPGPCWLLQTDEALASRSPLVPCWWMPWHGQCGHRQRDHVASTIKKPRAALCSG